MSINVRPEFFIEPESSNKECVNSIIQQIRPITSSIVSGALSGEIIFDITTGANQYLDLFKSHVNFRFTVTVTTPFAAFDSLGACIFDRGTLYINGVKVCQSNNWT